MKKATITFITSAALAFAIPLYAADEPGLKSDSQPQAGVTQQQPDQMESGQMMTAEKLKGMEVVSQKGEGIGEIEEVMIDQQSGEVKFVIISIGGILGMGGEEVAAPLSAFQISDEQARLTVDQSKLENVPQQKAEVTDSDYLLDLETHYGVAPAWEKGDRGDTTQTQQMDQEPTEPGKVDTKN
jgi:sporulation protein YlmC with PRC-barrel domain